MNKITLHMLGPFQADLDGQPITDFRTRKVQALLIYLATENKAYQRELLLDLLWPGLPERSARSNLRQIVYYLRNLIPATPDNGQPLIIANRQEILLNPEADIQADTAAFAALLEKSQSHSHLDLFLCSECRQDLEQAAALYRGDFLVDFYLDDSNEFEEWAQTQRQYFRRRVLDALSILTTIAIRQQDYSQAQAFARQQLDIDFLSENAYRQLMEALALSGRRQEALAVYESCRRVLHEELGMAPSAHTSEYFEKIQSGDLRFDAFPLPGLRGFELKEQIDEGVYGTIHRAVQTTIGREVAVKVIRRKFANDPEFIRRFEAEAQVIARLEHPYIVPLYDYWRDPHGAYLVMRYMRQGSLLAALQAGPWEADKTANMLDQVASALSIAHQHEVVHRDIKPGNILLDESSNAYLSDFGIAFDLTKGEPLNTTSTSFIDLDYISPEQILGEPSTPQSDIYSLGAVVYETLTGEKPFPNTAPARLLHHHLHEPLPPVTASRPDLPVYIDTVLQKATHKDPSQRYSNVLALAEAFRSAAQGLQPVSEARLTAEVPTLVEVYNPYKGLRAFQEADAADFFGRETLVQQLLDRLEAPSNGRQSRFLALVGPSGSGKSSVIKAGLIPALRQGALPGTDKWFIAEMVPGSRPFEELELALWSIAVEPPPNLVEPMKRDTGGLLRTLRRILPATPGAQLLLIIDQFEELFTLVEDQELRTFFLDSLLTAIRAPLSPLRLVVTLRADFYDRPLAMQVWGEILKENTEIVLPLNPSELTWAVREPARRMGVSLEEGLASAIVADVSDQPGALPLLQYAMTELFEQREGDTITHAAYQGIGGVQGALGQRAENLYGELDQDEQQAARQLFLRLVTLGEGVEDTRRRTLRTELEALYIHGQPDGATSDSPTDNAPSPISPVIDLFGQHRLLSFDRDPLTRSPTVEVAHEALLREWPRLRDWLVESRHDVRMQRLLAAAAAEWQQAEKDAGYLLRGSRLDLFEQWVESSSVALTADERAFLQASSTARQQRRAEEEVRHQRELHTAQKLVRTQRQRATFLASALVIAIILTVVALSFARTANQNAELASARQIEALAHAELAAAREAEALQSANLAATRQVEAQANAELATIREEEARQQARLAFSRELVASSILNLEEDPELSIMLAQHALTQAETLQAQEALHRALHSSRLLQRIPGTEDGHFGLPVVASADGARLAVGVYTGAFFDFQWQTEVRDAATLELLYTLPGWTLPVRLTDANRLVTLVGDADSRTVMIWDAAGQPVSSIALPLPLGGPPQVSPDLTWLVYQPAGSATRLLADLSTGEIVRELSSPLGGWVDFSPDGRFLAGNFGVDGRLVVWEAESGREVYSRPTRQSSAVAFNADGQQIAFAEANGAPVIIVDIASGQDVIALHGHTGQLAFAQFNVAGTRLATIGRDSSAFIWDTSTGEPLLRLGLDTSGPLPSATFTADDTRLVTSAGNEGLLLWQLSPLGEWLTLPGDCFCGFAFSRDGDLLAVGDVESVRVLTADTGQPVITLTSAITDPTQLRSEPVFSPDGTLVAAIKNGTTVVVWDVSTGQEKQNLDGHTDVVFGLAISPDGKRLATIAYDGTARLWDMTTGVAVYTLTDVYTGQLAVGGHWIDIAFSPDGAKLATAGGTSVKVWDTATGDELVSLQLPPDPLAYTVAFSPGGNHLAVGLQFGRGSGVWDVATGEKLFELAGHTASVGALAYSSDGRQIATGSVDGTIRLWNADTGEPTITLQGLGFFLAFNADDTRLAAQGADGILRLYALRLEDLMDIASSRLTRWFTLEECRRYLHLDACPPPPELSNWHDR
jgi:WD40 repeat protein/serine/threonine protein kinase/two-component SAPR family response regulator/energy-coupling factor transporter ATP-binding protein EcfA2